MASSDKGTALLKFICSMLFMGLFTVASKSTMLNSYFFFAVFHVFWKYLDRFGRLCAYFGFLGAAHNSLLPFDC